MSRGNGRNVVGKIFTGVGLCRVKYVTMVYRFLTSLDRYAIFRLNGLMLFRVFHYIPTLQHAQSQAACIDHGSMHFVTMLTACARYTTEFRQDSKEDKNGI